MKVIKAITIRLNILKNKYLSVIKSAITNNFTIKKTVTELKEYRKTIKVYDVFTFFNELELLEIRLNILDPFVDYFVLIESTETFSGKTKKLFYEENKDHFTKWHHKIIHYVIYDTPLDEQDLRMRLNIRDIPLIDKEIIANTLTSDNIPKGQIHWLKEFYQKESIKKALVGLNNTDICFISDVDEIWNPEAIIDYTKDNVYKLEQFVYAYYLNNRSSELWTGTLVTNYKNIRIGCLNHLRTASKTVYNYIKNGGWHFTNMGGAERIKNKLEASYDQEDYNTNAIKSQIKKRILNNQDYIGRKFKFWIDEKDLPDYIKNNKEKYKELLKDTASIKNYL